MPYLISFLAFVILPVILWYLLIRNIDKREPEPKNLLRRCFIIGMVSVVIAGFVEIYLYKSLGLYEYINDYTSAVKSSLSFFLVLSLFIAGPIEELFKYLIIRFSVVKNREFNQIFDGIVYGITVALGFSLLENTSYFIVFLSNDLPFSSFLTNVAVRGIVTTMVHVTATGTMGYFVAKAKFFPKERNSLLLKGIVFASLIHGIFNATTVIPYLNLLSGPIIIFVFGIFFSKWRSAEIQTIWKFSTEETLVEKKPELN